MSNFLSYLFAPNRCHNAMNEIAKALLSPNSKKIKFTLDLIEICSKNGNLNFHRLLSTKVFSELFMNLLKRVLNISLTYIEKREKRLKVKIRIKISETSLGKIRRLTTIFNITLGRYFYDAGG